MVTIQKVPRYQFLLIERSEISKTVYRVGLPKRSVGCPSFTAFPPSSEARLCMVEMRNCQNPGGLNSYNKTSIIMHFSKGDRYVKTGGRE